MDCPELTQKYQELLSLQEEFLNLINESKNFNDFSLDERKVKAEELNSTRERLELILSEFEISKRVKFKIAKKIMDQGLESGKTHCFGPEEVEKAFGVKINLKDAPLIPFSQIELQRAKELDQFLILRVDKAPDGEDLTMIKMYEMFEKLFKNVGKGKVLRDRLEGWCMSQKFFTKDKPECKWALTSKELIPSTINKDYLAQTEEASEYLKNQVFKGMEMPEEYKEAILELDAKKDDLRKLLETGDRNKYEPELSKLKINRLIRQSPVDTMYDILMYFQNNDERLLNGEAVWTHVTDSYGGRVLFGSFDSDGAFLSSGSDNEYGFVGVALSRKS